MDRLPEEWEGIPIDSDYQTGIQMFWALEDEELTDEERIFFAGRLLFGKNMPKDMNKVVEAINWFLGGWNTDKLPKGKTEKPVMDYQADQWRIWVAFLRQYNINVNRKKLHFWEFMALLRNLEECSFTRVIDIRTKVLDAKMSKEEQKYYREQKKIYELESKPKEYTEKEASDIDEFDRLRAKCLGKGQSEADKKRMDNFMRYAACQTDTTEVSE